MVGSTSDYASCECGSLAMTDVMAGREFHCKGRGGPIVPSLVS
jgi:hypothetical protein